MIDRLKNKKIAVLGHGTNNQSLVQFFAAHNISYVLFDNWGNPANLVGKLKGFDVIFRTPGLPYLSEAIQEARREGSEITSQTKLFFELCPCEIIGVTGTKGKGTTSSLIAKILSTSFKNLSGSAEASAKAGTAGGKKVWLGGNIGRDPFEFLPQIQKDDLVVLELSSFQLQDMEVSPHIAVVVNVGVDHLDHHHDLQEYAQAKLNILTHQKTEDFAILNSNLPDNFKTAGLGTKILFNASAAQELETKLLGAHNLENIAAAVETAKVLGIGKEVIQQAVAEFEPLPHRLSFVKEVRGVRYLDDSYSTNVESTIAAIKAITSNIVLIVGGAEKGIIWDDLGRELAASPRVTGLVVMGQTANKIIAATKGFKGQVAIGAKNMDEILAQAGAMAESGDTVLLSPGTSSFDMFKNATDRGEQFVTAVGRLT